jgi:carboxyl-terminal processing protease
MRVFSRTTLALVAGILLGATASIALPGLAARQPADAPAPADAMPANEPAAVAGGAAAAGALSPADERRIGEILERVRAEYVDEVTRHELVENALRGMVAGLDAYSEYLDRDEYDELRASTSGHYTGVGIELAATPRGLEVVRPIERSPAERAGVRGGDVIVGIDGEAVGSDVDGAIDRMRGPPGSEVRLSLLRGAAREPLEVAIERAEVDVLSASAQMLEPGFGYLRISAFSETTPREVETLLRTIKDQAGGRLQGLVIDLRNNPGGVLDAAVEVADAFLERGIIVTASGRTEEARFRMDATPGELVPGTRIALLVNGGSASAAEILAGALRDNGRAVLVGRQTYGKGSVQTLIPLSEGRALKLTTSLYATPSGAVIDARGIEPDVPLSGADASSPDVRRDAEVRRALESLRNGRRGAVARSS